MLRTELDADCLIIPLLLLKLLLVNEISDRINKLSIRETILKIVFSRDAEKSKNSLQTARVVVIIVPESDSWE